MQYNPCPMFEAGDDACCSLYQLASLYVNLKTLNFKFGKQAYGGCPACFANLRTAWCLQTCSPRQAELVSHANVTTVDGNKVLEYTLNMNKNWACAVYDSCSAVSTVVEGAFNCEGLWNYQGQAPVVQQNQHVFINFNFTEAAMPQAVEAPLQYCCGFQNTSIEDTDQPGYGKPGNSSCTCASCKAACPGEVCPVTQTKPSRKYSPEQLSKPLYDTLYGFRYLPVAIFYGVILVASVLLSGFQCWQHRKQVAALQGAEDARRQSLL